MLKKIVTYIAVVSFIVTSFTMPASAIQSPGGCNSNRLSLSLARDKLTVQQGEVLTYTVTLSNVDFGGLIACDIDNAIVTLTLPALDGTATGQVITLTSNGNYPAGTAVTTIGTVPYTVNVNPSVVDATAQASVNGVLHDAPTDHAAQISKTIGTTVTHPAPAVPTPAPATPSASTPPAATTQSLPGMPNTSTR
jgi:hypothetical protein